MVGLCASPSAGEPAPLGMMKKMKHTSAVLIAASLCCWCNSEPLAEEHSEIIHPKAFAMVTCWLSDTEQPVVTEISLDAVRINRNQFYGLVTSSEDGWVRYSDEESGGFLVHPVNGEVPPVKGRPWKLPHYANRGKTSSSGGELASARSCFSTVRTALGKLRITGLLARFDVARSFPQFPRPLLLQPTIWTSERGADLGSGRCQPRPHLPIYRMTRFPSLSHTRTHRRSSSRPVSGQWGW